MPEPTMTDKLPDIRLLRITQLHGPNLWTYRPALEVWLDLGELEQRPSNTLPGLIERLTAWLPGLVEHHCGVGERGGFLQRLQDGTWAGHVLEHVVIELLNRAGLPTGFGQTRSTSKPGIYRMVVRSRDEQVTREALACSHRLLMAAINDETHDVGASVERIRERLDRCWLGPSTQAIVAAAIERGIPHLRLNDGNLVQLGHGARQRRIWTAETDHTSAIAEGISHDKNLTKQLLSACGVPVPEGQRVASAAEAWDAAQDIGLPVVVKPRDGNHGRGVTLELGTEADVAAAYALADAHGSAVIVERHVRGDEHRLLVVGGKVVAAVRGESTWITGDGRSTVADLIERQINSDPRRGEGEDCPLGLVKLDDPEIPVAQELKRQGLAGDSVPADGRRALVVRTGNLGVDCTDEVHPEVAHAAALAARVVGLDIAGVDLVCEDIGRPLAAQGGAIVEVNAGPGLLMHLKPAVGKPRPVGEAIVEQLFPTQGNAGPSQVSLIPSGGEPSEARPSGRSENDGRIPLVGVAGSLHSAQVARLVAWLLHLHGRKVGLACADGLFIGQRRLERRPVAGFSAGQRLLINREVQAAVIECGARAILRDGLPYDRCSVGVVTDLGGAEQLADFDVHDAEQVARVLRTQVDVVLPSGAAVLHAGDSRIAAMAELCDGDVILYAASADAPALKAHRGAGSRTGFVRDGRLVFAAGHDEVAEAPLPAPRGMPADPLALLAGACAAWALGVPHEQIVAGLHSFGPVLPDAAPCLASVTP
jgi:cyanophycin synthetase